MLVPVIVIEDLLAYTSDLDRDRDSIERQTLGKACCVVWNGSEHFKAFFSQTFLGF
jgi:hypothetical protein